MTAKAKGPQGYSQNLYWHNWQTQRRNGFQETFVNPTQVMPSTVTSRMNGRTGIKVPMDWDSSVRARTQCMRNG